MLYLHQRSPLLVIIFRSFTKQESMGRTYKRKKDFTLVQAFVLLITMYVIAICFAEEKEQAAEDTMHEHIESIKAETADSELLK